MSGISQIEFLAITTAFEQLTALASQCAEGGNGTDDENAKWENDRPDGNRFSAIGRRICAIGSAF